MLTLLKHQRGVRNQALCETGYTNATAMKKNVKKVYDIDLESLLTLSDSVIGFPVCFLSATTENV